MNQAKIAGIVILVIGQVLACDPGLIWKLTEKWKNRNPQAPSKAFIWTLRVVGSVFTLFGLLLIAGVLK